MFSKVFLTPSSGGGGVIELPNLSFRCWVADLNFYLIKMAFLLKDLKVSILHYSMGGKSGSLGR